MRSINNAEVADVYWAKTCMFSAEDRLLLSNAELDRYNRMPAGPAAQNFLAGRSILRQVIGRREDQNPRSVLVSTPTPRGGKPFLPGLPWQVSLTHAGGWIGLAVTRKIAVGLDLEIPRDLGPMSCCQGGTHIGGAGLAHRTAPMETPSSLHLALGAQGIGCQGQRRGVIRRPPIDQCHWRTHGSCQHRPATRGACSKNY